MSFLKKHWLIILILIVGAFLRLYKIDEYMTFLGDEGRDVIVVRNLLVKADPILIGPGTSVGGMYLGPLYYYFMAPFLLLSNFNPVGPAIGVALLGVATIYLVYLVGLEWFTKGTGLIAAFIYAISPTVITYSHSSWNPNIMPFFALLSIYSIWKVWKEDKHILLILTAISMAFVFQSHYLGTLLVPVVGLVWFAYILKNWKIKNNRKVTLKYTFFAFMAFIFLMSPLVIFDIRHDYMNSKALYKFLTVRQETVSIRPWTAVPKIYPIFEEINSSLLTAKETFGKYINIVLSLFLIFFGIKNIKKVKENSGFYILGTWILVALIGFGIYKQHIYDHYFGFLFPAPFLLLGLLISKLFSLKSYIYKIFGVILIGILIFVNLNNNPFKFGPNNQMKRSIDVSNKILEVTNGTPFNLAVLAERNYEDGYRYFLEVNGATVLHADKWDKNTISDVLMVICEMPKEKCDPTHSPKAEVANFGWSKILDEWNVDGVVIYKLIHSQ